MSSQVPLGVVVATNAPPRYAKTPSRCPKMRPRRSPQDAPKTLQDGPSFPQDVSKTPQDVSMPFFQRFVVEKRNLGLFENRAPATARARVSIYRAVQQNHASRCSKMLFKRPKMPPTHPRTSPKTPNASRNAPRRSLDLPKSPKTPLRCRRYASKTGKHASKRCPKGGSKGRK